MGYAGLWKKEFWFINLHRQFVVNLKFAENSEEFYRKSNGLLTFFSCAFDTLTYFWVVLKSA